MPRTARLVFENAFYHVFNRGVNKQPIFLTHADYQFFLNKLKALKLKFDHSIYAFCLMPNHFHLSIQSRKSSISTILSSLTTSYSMYFNRTHSHSGPVFQNRFKSLLIQDDSYFLQLAQYIYLNPVRANLVKDPVIYPYSGLAEALGQTRFTILDPDIVRLIGTTPAEMINFKKFIYSGLDKNFEDIESLFEKPADVYGSASFYTSSQRKYLRRKKLNI